VQAQGLISELVISYTVAAKQEAAATGASIKFEFKHNIAWTQTNYGK
jgi:ssRNA-specific RNase YbeY (16S rRNA maturation enzyme)